MEVKTTESVKIAIQESSQIAEARRIVGRIAEGIGFDETRAGQVAIVVTEVCTNLLKHAGGGAIIVGKTETGPASAPGLEVLALDQGPGMADLNRCRRDGYSTGSSPGQGLGAIQRLSTESDFYSLPAKGTAVLARWSPTTRDSPSERPEALRIGAVSISKPGQEECGDSWGALQTPDHSVIVVADGLGHGIEARAASREAIRILYLNPEMAPQALLERIHQALRSSRGAAVAVARIDRFHGTVSFAGAGNVAARIYAGAEARQHLVSVNGTAGHQTQRLREFHYPWPQNGMLILYSDGLTTGTGLEADPALALRDASLIAGVLYRDFNRGHDDATVVVAKPS